MRPFNVLNFSLVIIESWQGAFFRAKLLRPGGTPSAATLSAFVSTLVLSSLIVAVLYLHEKRPTLPKKLNRASQEGK